MDDTALIKILYQTAGVGDVKAATAAVKDSEIAATRVSAAVKKSGEDHANALGMSRREWMRTGSEAAFYLTSMTGKTGEASSALTKMTGIATQLGESFMFGGGVGIGLAAVATAISAVTAKQQEEAKAFQDAIKPSDDLVASINNLSGAHDALGQQIAIVLNLTGQEADAIALATRNYEGMRAAVQDQARLREQMISIGQNLKKQAEDLSVIGVDPMAIESYRQEYELLKSLTTQYLDNTAAIKQQAPALNETKRQVDAYASAIPKLAAETAAYTAEVAKMNAEHKKAAAGFQRDDAAAEAKATKDRIKAEENASDQIEKINHDLGQRLAEMERDRNQAAERFAKDRLKIEQDLKKSIERLNSDETDAATDLEEERQAELEAVRKKYGTLELNSGKVYTEEELKTRKGFLAQQSQEAAAAINTEYNKKIEKLKRETEQRKKEAEEQAAERRQELEEREREQREEFEYRRQLMVQQAEEQKKAAAEVARKQLEMIAEALRSQQEAITKRRNDEEEAYKASTAAATQSYNAKILQLKDIRTENEKIITDWETIKNRVDATTRSLVEQSGVLGTMHPIDWTTFTGMSKPAGWYASGLDTIIDRPTVIGVGEAGPERVTVTPAGRGSSSIAIYGGIHFHGSGSPANAAGADRAASLFIDAIRRKGMQVSFG